MPNMIRFVANTIGFLEQDVRDLFSLFLFMFACTAPVWVGGILDLINS